MTYQPEYDAAPIGHNKPPSDAEILQSRLDAYIDEADELDRLSGRELPDEVKSDDEAKDLTLYIKAIAALEKRYTDAHKREKQPYLDLGRQVDGWKTDMLARLDALRKAASPLVLAWTKKKDEEERQRQFELAKKQAEDAERLRAEAEAHRDEGIEETADELAKAADYKDRAADSIIQNVITAAPGSLAKVSTAGASAAIKAPWKGELDSRAALDLEKLRPFFTEDSLQKAINAFVRDGGRQLNGARIYQDEKLSIR